MILKNGHFLCMPQIRSLGWWHTLINKSHKNKFILGERDETKQCIVLQDYKSVNLMYLERLGKVFFKYIMIALGLEKNIKN